MIGNCFFDFPYLERYRIFLFLFSVFLLLKGIWEFQNEYFERVTGMSKKIGSEVSLSSDSAKIKSLFGSR